MSDVPKKSVPRYPWMPAAVAVVLLGAAVHLALDAWRHQAPWTNNDNALILFIAREMANGARLYVDWLDPALPSIFFIARIAVGVSQFGVPVVLAYNLLVLAVGTVGAVVVVQALSNMRRPRSSVILAVSGYILFLMKASALTRDFGQREHLFALLLIPELFSLQSDYRPRWRPVWCAVLAFTATIKPHFVVIIALLELTAPRGKRSSTVDLAGFAVGALAPFVLLWGHSPESFRALFTETLALHLSGAYALLNASPRALLARGPFIVFGAAIVAAGLMVRAAGRAADAKAIAWRGGLTIVAAILTVLHQQKYFPYHFTPVFGVAIVCGMWALGELLQERPAWLAGGLGATAMLLGAAAFHADIARNADPLSVRLAQAVGVREPRLAVASIYSHGLCTPFAGAPRCLGPEAQWPRLPYVARQPDGAEQVRRWAAAFGEIVRAERPELLAISTGNAVRLPSLPTPAQMLMGEAPVIGADYVPLSPATVQRVGARGWLILRRQDVPEATDDGGR